MQDFGVIVDPLAIAEAEGEATPSTAIGDKGERAALPPLSGDTPGGSVAGLTSRMIAEDIYRRLGWSR